MAAPAGWNNAWGEYQAGVTDFSTVMANKDGKYTAADQAAAEQARNAYLQSQGGTMTDQAGHTYTQTSNYGSTNATNTGSNTTGSSTYEGGAGGLKGTTSTGTLTRADGTTMTIYYKEDGNRYDANGNIVTLQAGDRVKAENGKTYVVGASGDTSPYATSNQTTQTQQTQQNVSQQQATQAAQANEATYADTTALAKILQQWLDAAKKQSDTSVDYATNQAILELQRTQEDAKAQYDTQRNQIAADEQRALDNQALYAEARGDKGGIGQAQYNSIMNTAAQNRLTVNNAQTKLSTDTARQIADLRAQGEYEKADAYLELTQEYLSQLMSLQQWGMEFNLTVDQFNQSIAEWQAEYELKLADITGEYQGQTTVAMKSTLAEAGLALAEAGITPSASQLAAMKELYGYDEATVNSLVSLAQQSATSSSSSTGSGSGSTTTKAPSYKTDPLGYLEYYGVSYDHDAAYHALTSAGMDEEDAEYYASQYEGKATPTTTTRIPNESGSGYDEALSIIQALRKKNATAQEIRQIIADYSSSGRITSSQASTLIRTYAPLSSR